MSTDRETTRIVRSWLEEGVTALPDRVLDAVLGQVPATPQRRSSWPTRRIARMNRLVVPLSAAAATLVVAILGYNLVTGPSGPGGPTSTPTTPPTAAPTAKPTPAPIPTMALGALEPGRYAWYSGGLTVSFEVPVGWYHDEEGVRKNRGESAEIVWADWLPESYPITHVYSDACRSAGRLAPVGPTVEDLVQALTAQAGSDAVVTDVTIGGLPAKRVGIVQSPSVDRSTCRNGATGPLQIWADAAEIDYYALRPGASGVVYIVDVGGARVVFTSAIGAKAAPSDVSELDRIIESIEFAGR